MDWLEFVHWFCVGWFLQGRARDVINWIKS